MRVMRIGGGLLAMLLLPAVLQAAPSVPARWTKALAHTPDLTQTDPRAKFPEGGDAYCGPVAVANTFVRLAREGYPRLAPLAPDPVLAQIDIVRILADTSHMATCASTGTSTAHLLEGIQRYVQDRGYGIRTLAYRGWRPRLRTVRATHSAATLDWIKAQVSRASSGAWMNVGWYVRDPKRSGVLRRTGGHWVTLAGYGLDARGAPDPNVLILRDPSPRAGTRARYEFVRVAAAAAWRLEGPQRGLPRPARQMLRIREGLTAPAGTDVILVDGVVALHLRAAKTTTPAAGSAADVGRDTNVVSVRQAGR